MYELSFPFPQAPKCSSVSVHSSHWTSLIYYFPQLLCCLEPLPAPSCAPAINSLLSNPLFTSPNLIFTCNQNAILKTELYHVIALLTGLASTGHHCPYEKIRRSLHGAQGPTWASFHFSLTISLLHTGTPTLLVSEILQSSFSPHPGYYASSSLSGNLLPSAFLYLAHSYSCVVQTLLHHTAFFPRFRWASYLSSSALSPAVSHYCWAPRLTSKGTRPWPCLLHSIFSANHKCLVLNKRLWTND